MAYSWLMLSGSDAVASCMAYLSILVAEKYVTKSCQGSQPTGSCIHLWYCGT
jgi:hypothetical protein